MPTPRLVLATVLALAIGAPAAIAPPAFAQTPAQPRQQQRPAAASDLITEGNLSRDGVLATLKQAGLDAAIDEDGDIKISGRVTAFAFPSKDRIRLLVNYGFKPEATMLKKLELANRINDDFIVVRATVGGRNQGQMKMDYYILVGAGISKATVVATVKRFMTIVPDAVKEHDTDDIVK